MLPISNTTWASCSASVLVQNVVARTLFLHVCHCPTHHVAGLLVSDACSLLSHSTDCQHTDSGIANSKHCHLPDVSHSVSSLHLLASTAEIHRCGQACRQKLLASTSCSIWLHPLNDFAPSTLIQMAPLLQCCPCPGQNDKALSRFPSLGNCLQPMHSDVPFRPSKHDQVQLLSCTSSRRLLEIAEAVPESSSSLVLHVSSSLSSLMALQSPSELWIDIV